MFFCYGSFAEARQDRPQLARNYTKYFSTSSYLLESSAASTCIPVLKRRRNNDVEPLEAAESAAASTLGHRHHVISPPDKLNSCVRSWRLSSTGRWPVSKTCECCLWAHKVSACASIFNASSELC